MPSDIFASALLLPEAAVPAGVKGNVPRRFAVYRNNVVVGLTRAMESNFPVIARLLGAQYFAGLAREFVKQSPPKSPLMFNYGEAFPSYLQSQHDLRNYPYLGDVANLEILMRQSYHAGDANILAAESLADISPDALGTLHFIPHPALRLLQSGFAVVSIVEANRTDEALAPPNPHQPECAMMTRPGFDVVVKSLTAAQFQLVQSLATGKCLSEAADKAFELDAEFDLASMLAVILSSGAFMSII